MKITKPEGGTRTERLLATLCEKTFLKLWSWPTPRKEDGKELCDLIAIFDDHVFIFFDRESKAMRNTDKDVKMTWNRWKKEVIDKQINTARRWMHRSTRVIMRRTSSCSSAISGAMGSARTTSAKTKSLRTLVLQERQEV